MKLSGLYSISKLRKFRHSVFFYFIWPLLKITVAESLGFLFKLSSMTCIQVRESQCVSCVLEWSFLKSCCQWCLVFFRIMFNYAEDWKRLGDKLKGYILYLPVGVSEFNLFFHTWSLEQFVENQHRMNWELFGKTLKKSIGSLKCILRHCSKP